MTVSLWLGWYRAGAEAIKTLEHAVHHHFWERFWGRGANVGIHTEANDRPVVQLGAGVTRQEFPQGAPAAGLGVCREMSKSQEFQ